MKLRSVTVNSTRANDGAWVSGLQGMDDLKLRVRGFTYEPYRATLAAETSKVGPEGRVDGRIDGAIKRPVMDKITGRAMAEHILLDWTNLFDDEGKPILYDIDQALTYLLHPDYRPFNAFVEMAAMEVERLDSTRVSASSGN